jgi:hypothetical protein
MPALPVTTPGAVPPAPPAIVRSAADMFGSRPVAPACHYLNNAEAQVAFERLKRNLPSTRFTGARPSEICGLVRVDLAGGTAAYTDATGRYFLLAFALDTNKGSPADNADTLNTQIARRQQNPVTAETGARPEPTDPQAGPATSTSQPYLPAQVAEAAAQASGLPQ